MARSVSRKFYLALLTGTALSLATPALATTVVIGSSHVVNSDPNDDPAILFNSGHIATVADGVNLTGTNGVAVTTNNDGMGILRFNGDSTVTGTVGAGNKLDFISFMAANKTVSFDSEVNAQYLVGSSIDNTIVNFGGDVTSNIQIVGSAGPTFNFADGVDVTGDISGGGVLTMAFAGTSTITGTDLGVVAGYHLGALTFSGNTGKQLTINSTDIYTNVIAINGTGTVLLNGTVHYGGVDFNADGVLRIADNIDAGGNINNISGTDGVGTVQVVGGMIVDSINTTHTLKALTFEGDNRSSYITGVFKAADTTSIGNNTVTASGDVTFVSGQTLSTVVSADNTYGHIQTATTANISSGTIVNVTINSGVNVYEGLTYRIVDATTGSGVGTIADLNVTDNSGKFLLHWAQDTSDTRDLVITASVANLATPTTTSNNNRVASVLQALGTNGDDRLDMTRNALINSSNAAQYNQKLSSLLPTADVGNVEAEIQASRGIFEVASRRLEEVRAGESGTSGISSGDITKGVTMWAQATGQKGKQGERDGVSGYKFSSQSTTLGFDSKNFSEKLVAGASFSLGGAEVNSQSANAARSNIDSYQLSVFSDYHLCPKTYLTTMLGYAYNDIDQKRYNIASVANNNASAGYHAQQYIAYSELGHKFAVNNKMSLTPSVLGHYQHVAIDNYTETGSTANLTVNSSDVDVLELGTGLKADWAFKDEHNRTIRPYVSAGYRYDVLGDNMQTVSTFTGGGTSFTTEGPDAARGTASFNAGVTFDMTDKWSVTTNYEYQSKADFNSNAAYVRASYKF